MNAPAAALIVGGGIGGLACALAIAQTGREVRLLEQAPQFVEIGAGLQVGPNATRMLDHLGVLGPVLDVAVFPEHGVMMNAVTGVQLTVLDLGAPFHARYGYPYLVIHRSDLLSILLDACRAQPGITLENNKIVTQVAVDGEQADVTCADGSRYTSALLIGADGLNSRVRTLIDTSPPRRSGYVAYRGTTPMSEVPTDVAAQDVVLWVGPGFHLIQYPIRRSELYNQVAVFRSDRFTRGVEPCGTSEEFDRAFDVACDDVKRHVTRIARDRSWPIYDRDPLPTWTYGPAALIGDAAHPMLQYLGQGACQALEDAWTLGRALAAEPDGATATAAYEKQRIDRASRCQLAARPWGEIWHTDDPAMLGLRRRFFERRQPDDYTDLDWLYLPTELETEHQ